MKHLRYITGLLFFICTLPFSLSAAIDAAPISQHSLHSTVASAPLPPTRKAKKWQKRVDRLEKKLQKRMERLAKKGKLNGRINLSVVGLIVLLFGGLFIALGLVIPAVGIVFLVLGIIIAFVGLLLMLLLSGMNVEVS